MAQEYPTLNEIEPSWADIKISIPIYGGLLIATTDIAAVKWSDKVDVGVSYGTNGGRKKKRTTGKYDCDASITFYKSGWKTVREALAAKRTDKRISLVGFDIIIQHTPPDSSGIFTVKILGCRVIGRGGDEKEGTDPSQIEVPISVMTIEEDGVSLL